MSLAEYKRNLKIVSVREFSVGLTTIHLFSEAEFSDGQLGYSINSNGNSLVGDKKGDWKQNWFVIGYEDLCGDPIFTDLSRENFPVFTAAHGTGNWEPILIADNFDSFIEKLEIIMSRKSPNKKLEDIQRLNRQSDLEFWKQILEIE